MTAPRSTASSTVLAAAHGSELRVTGKQVRADGVLTLDLASPTGDRLPDWTPGSHIDLVLPNGMTRQYSLCGDRRDPFSYRVGVLREPTSRGGSHFVHDVLDVGDLVGVGGPRNNFPLVPAEKYLFVAGGIGITPMLAMIDAAEVLGVDWELLYAGRRRASMAFLDELARFGDRVHVRPTDELGRMDLRAFLGEPRDQVRVYCCGPATLLAAVEAVCADWPPYALRVERFQADQLGAPARQAPFEVELARTGVTVSVTADVSVLDAIGAAGVEVLSSCRQGVCGTCEITVLAGEPDHRDTLLDDAERAVGDCMYVCVSRARSDRLVLDL